ncbi:MAG: hypothetical protein LBQ77_05070 [Treponema sp.]|jgi:hypothetical protein|nr:hypothetical protein [Treponema sp.]
MFGFLLKKTLYDLWDNLLKIAVFNMGFIACAALIVLVPPLIPHTFLAFCVLFVSIVFGAMYLATVARSVKELSDYQSVNFSDFIPNFRKSWLTGAIFGTAVFIFWILITIAIPFYLDMGTLVGLFFAAILFWTLVLGILSFQFLFAIRFRLNNPLLKSVKKCFIIFFDNPGFAIGTFISTIVLLALSVFFAFLFPGPAGALLFLDEGFRLRLLKYDWIEENPTADRRHIPWDVLLIDEREKTGSRSLRSFIFPWKD